MEVVGVFPQGNRSKISACTLQDSVEVIGVQRWLAKFGQVDKWNFCLRAARMPQVLECEGEQVLAAVGRDFSQHDGRRYDAGFSDERLIEAAGAVVADRPEQRPLLVIALASRLKVVVDAPLPVPRCLLPVLSAGSGASRLIGLGSSTSRHGT